jgi:hypothetical protein
MKSNGYIDDDVCEKMRLKVAGATSLRAIAAGLNARRRIPTARGDGEWSAVQVIRYAGRAVSACRI